MTKAYPQCEKCYLEENTQWEPESVGDDGSLVSKLIAVSVPLEIKTGKINVCAQCGDITVVGIYAEMEEDSVQYDVDPLDVDDLNVWPDDQDS
jgi:hypothetical protein